MIRTLAISVWICLVVVGSAYASMTLGLNRYLDSSHKAAPEVIESVRAKAISVPILSKDQVLGYVIAGFIARINGTKAKKHSVKIEDYLIDEGFRAVYETEGMNFQDMRKQYIERLTTTIAARINKRVGDEIVKEVLVQEFTFVARKDARQ
jgi:hypothetical protein